MKGSTCREAVRVLLTTTALLSILPSAANAQQAGTSNPAMTQSPAASTSDRSTRAENDEESRGAIGDIVVTARRSSENAQRVPIAITTLTSQELTARGVRDIFDVQQSTPSLFISSNQGSAKARLYIRGLGEVDDKLTGDRGVGVYIDGVALTNSYGLRASLIDVAQVEVLKGPQGTLFGRNTTGGALNITTQHPEYRWGGYVDLLYGSYNNAQALAVINAPIVDDKLAIRAALQVISRDGYYPEFASGKKGNDDNTFNGRLLIRADPVEDIHILLSGDFLKVRNGYNHAAISSESLLASQNSATGLLGAAAAQLGLNPASATDRATAYSVYRSYVDRSIAEPRVGFASLSDARDNLDIWGVSANVQIDLGGVALKSITSYRSLDRDQAYDLDNTPLNLLSQHQSAYSSDFSQEVQLSSIDNVGLDWQAGAFYSRSSGNDYNATDQADYVNPNRAVVTESGVVNSSKAVYGQAVYHITPTLRVTGGIRYTADYREIDSKNRIELANAVAPLPPGGVNRCNLLAPALGGPTYPNCTYKASVDYDQTTWLASADWRPIDGLMLYGSVSTGYRAGAFTAPGNSSPITTVVANTAAFTPYAPEKVTNYEVGFKGDLLDRRLRVNGAFFYMDYKDIQVRIRDLVNSVLIQIVRNAASATIYGAELEVTAVPVDGLTLNGVAGYLHARYNSYRALDPSGNLLDLSDQPFTAPEWTYDLSATYVLPLNDGALRFSGSYSYQSTANFVPGTLPVASVSQPGFGLLNARIGWHIESQDLDVSVFAKNLADQRYIVSAFPVGVYNGVNLGDPRSFGIQLRKNF
jgi:iron complex outermembrane receptor protein